MPDPLATPPSIVTDGLTEAQTNALERLATKLGAWPFDISREDHPTLMEFEATFTIGEAKGRPKVITIDVDGSVCS